MFTSRLKLRKYISSTVISNNAYAEINPLRHKMSHIANPGLQFRQLVSKSKSVLQVIGATNAYHALMAKNLGLEAVYLSGAGVANASFGLPDLGITTLNDVVTDAHRIIQATHLPMLVDIDMGFGSQFNIARSIRELESVGVAAVHIEDQEGIKRCGHRPNKSLCSTQEMCDRIASAVNAKTNPDFVVMARCDALASEGLESFIQRCVNYVEAGADMIFAEALPDISQYIPLHEALGNNSKKMAVPILANMTEFGKTPLYSTEQLAKAGVSIALYPLSPFRAANKAAENVYKTLLSGGSQDSLVPSMQTRDELYKHLDYLSYESHADILNTKS